MSQEKSNTSYMKPAEAIWEFGEDQWSKEHEAYQHCFSTFKQCHGFGNTARKAVVLPRNIMVVFVFIRCEKPVKCSWSRWGCAGSLSRWKAKRWDWPFWHQLGFGSTMHGSNSFWHFPPSALGYTYKPNTQVQTSIILRKDSNTLIPRTPSFFISQRRSHTTKFCISANRPVPSGITVQLQAMEAEKREWITADYINAELHSAHRIITTFLQQKLSNT